MRTIFESIVALLVLIILLPVLTIIAMAVMLDSPGPLFYRAPRVGRGGKPFRMWKFRTMVADAPKMGPSITGHHDPRITRTGKFLRVTKLDEIPQFVNVLLGDMSLVGPRPESPDIVALYTAEQRAVLAAKPGVTGVVQLDSGEESESIPENVKADEYYVQHLMARKLSMDLEYLERRTPLTDLKIVLRTAGYVLRRCLRRAAELCGARILDLES